MSAEAPKYKKLLQEVDSERYRTDTSTLLAYDENAGKFLFRALNSNYFVQDDKTESIEVLEMDEAERCTTACQPSTLQISLRHFPSTMEVLAWIHTRICMMTEAQYRRA